ncbi:polyhydroxyalkanoate synthesis regulator phasin [Saccharothrix tamanrassetensis]|uniref:Polyhydroxyalkanoate synthesis regulator phasin n=1 Tax=Saccharothrix tamanrassetensis TaxID=1051531 RepID=A0A841CM49_9PSEU|nr:hypothetical protein [Saccharothrix tamanrassetensis]MBB5957167.1 polyhydroxyalkanoate synthesis regulator phasin [Saccharothrix tamanrassetensis]
MTTSRTKRKRTGIIGYLGNIADDTKDYIDDMLDRGRDVDRDVRSTARRALRDDDDERPDTSEDIAALQDDLAELTRKVTELSAAQTAQAAHSQPKKTP